jgi:hypothetical protein
MRREKKQSLYDFSIGDLVRLTEDRQLEIGLGVIADIKENLEDVYDLEYLRNRIQTLHNIIDLQEDIFPSTPQILVLWSTKKITNNNITLWMYAEELTVLQKVIKT